MGLPFQELSSVVAFVLCNGVRGSKLLSRDELGGSSTLRWKALHNLVRDQRLLAASLEAYGPVSGPTGCTDQSELGVECCNEGSCRAMVHESQES